MNTYLQQIHDYRIYIEEFLDGLQPYKVSILSQLNSISICQSTYTPFQSIYENEKYFKLEDDNVRYERIKLMTIIETSMENLQISFHSTLLPKAYRQVMESCDRWKGEANSVFSNILKYEEIHQHLEESKDRVDALLFLKESEKELLSVSLLNQKTTIIKQYNHQQQNNNLQNNYLNPCTLWTKQRESELSKAKFELSRYAVLCDDERCILLNQLRSIIRNYFLLNDEMLLLLLNIQERSSSLVLTFIQPLLPHIKRLELLTKRNLTDGVLYGCNNVSIRSDLGSPFEDLLFISEEEKLNKYYDNMIINNNDNDNNDDNDITMRRNEPIDFVDCIKKNKTSLTSTNINKNNNQNNNQNDDDESKEEQKVINNNNNNEIQHNHNKIPLPPPLLSKKKCNLKQVELPIIIIPESTIQLKRLHWSIIKNNNHINNTIFRHMLPRKKDIIYILNNNNNNNNENNNDTKLLQIDELPMIDLIEFNESFARNKQSTTTTTSSSTDNNKNNNNKKKIQLLNKKREYNLSIRLSRYALSYNDLLDGILYMNNNIFTLEQINGLNYILPTQEELLLIQNYNEQQNNNQNQNNNNINLLSCVCQWFYTISVHNNNINSDTLHTHVSLFQFYSNIDISLGHVRSCIDIYKQSCIEMKDSKVLPLYFSSILLFGNYLNKNALSSSSLSLSSTICYGFELNSLKNISNLKNRNNKNENLLSYIVKYINRFFPTYKSLNDELSTIELCTSIDFITLHKEWSEINKNINLLHPLPDNIMKLKQQVKNNMIILDREYNKVQNDIVNIMKYFSFQNGDIKHVDLFWKLIHNFIKDVNVCQNKYHNN